MTLRAVGIPKCFWVGCAKGQGRRDEEDKCDYFHNWIFSGWNYLGIVSTSSGGRDFKSPSSRRTAARDARKLLQRASGIAATAIKASWLTINPTSQGNAFCINP